MTNSRKRPGFLLFDAVLEIALLLTTIFLLVPFLTGLGQLAEHHKLNLATMTAADFLSHTQQKALYIQNGRVDFGAAGVGNQLVYWHQNRIWRGPELSTLGLGEYVFKTGIGSFTDTGNETTQQKVRIRHRREEKVARVLEFQPATGRMIYGKQ